MSTHALKFFAFKVNVNYKTLNVNAISLKGQRACSRKYKSKMYVDYSNIYCSRGLFLSRG